MITVACVLNGGGEYVAAHVAALHAGVARWWPGGGAALRFVCLASEPVGLLDGVEVRALRHAWPGWWSKMELFAPEHDDLGALLYLDLDTVVVGDLTALAGVERVTMLRDFYRPQRLASGLMYLPVAARAVTWSRWWIGTPSLIMRQFRTGGDGGFLDLLWNGVAAAWQDVLPGQVVSYKVHVRPQRDAIPAAARLVCFHGRPRPWETVLWNQT